MASTPRAQTFSGRRVQLDRAPLARPRVPERPGSPRCRSGSSRPGRCNVFDSGAAHECRLEDAEAYDFFETFPKVSAEGMASIAIESNVCLDWNRLTLSLSLSLSLSLARSRASRTTHNTEPVCRQSRGNRSGDLVPSRPRELHRAGYGVEDGLQVAEVPAARRFGPVYCCVLGVPGQRQEGRGEAKGGAREAGRPGREEDLAQVSALPLPCISLSPRADRRIHQV